MKALSIREARKNERRFWQQIIITASAAALTVGVAIFTGGCGSGGAGTGFTNVPGAGSGRLAVAIKWPASSGRLIPSASQHIKAVLSAGATILDTKQLVRPTQPPWTTSVTFDNLQAGTVTLTATAFPNADGTGNAQASGSVPATITSGQQASVTLTMATTVQTLKVTPPTPSVNTGSSVQLTATAYDKDGNVVLVTPGNITWTPAASGNATVSPATGQTTSATGVMAGTQVVTATESESKVSGSATVTVTQQTGCAPGPVAGPGFLAGSAWPKFGGASPGNSGKSTGGGATGVLKWTAALGKGGNAQATIGPDGTLYMESYYDKNFWAIDSATGKVKWSYTADTGGNTTPAVSKDGTVYFASSLYLYAMDAARGTVKWKTRSDVSASPIIGLDGTVYAGAARGLLAYDSTNGSIKWSTSAGAIGYSYVAPTMASDGTVFGVSLITGGALLTRLDGRCGTSTWSVPLNVNALSLGSDGTIYATVEFTFSNKTHVVAVDPATGAVKWSSATIPVQPTPPAIDDARGVLYVLGQHGELTALGMATGATKWTYQPQSSSPGELMCNSSPSIGSDGTVYIVVFGTAKQSSSLFAVDPASAQPKWQYNVPGVGIADSTTPTIGADGTVYFFDRGSGTLYAIK